MTESPTDTLLEVVGHLRRRHVIECLREQPSMTMADLADAVAVRDYERPIEEISEKSIEGVHLTLLHSHLPKLERAEIVEYVREPDIVSAGAAFEQAVELSVAVEGGSNERRDSTRVEDDGA